MGISDITIEQVKGTAAIEEVVGDFVSLKRKGQNLWACCPFHDEKTPSFSVAPSKGIYKCFGCGKAGDSIQFIMDVEGLTYIESIRYLAAKYGIEVKEDDQTDPEQHLQNEKESLLIVLNFAKEYFKNLLWNSDEGKAVGFSYFKERGFHDDTITAFELGYSRENWDGFLKEATLKEYSGELLEKAGLIIKKEDKIYDRFRGRVIFPIHNISGKVIAFGARILKADKKQPKYLNSPETEVYHKGKILYGIHQARQFIRQDDNCYLVEGYTDVISLHQAGVKNVVASSGTSLTEEQVKLISRYTKNITVLFDGDAAGIKASLRGIDMILESGLNVRAVAFPDGEDPDSFARKLGSSAFQDYIKSNTTDFITFKAGIFVKEAGNDPIRKADTIREIIESISKIPEPLKRAVYIKECSSLLQIDEQVLFVELNKIQIAKQQEKNRKASGVGSEKSTSGEGLVETPSEILPEAVDPVSVQERESIRLLLSYGSQPVEGSFPLHQYLLNEIDDIEFKTPVYKEILDQFKEKLTQGIVLSEKDFIANATESVRNVVIDLVSEKYFESPNWKNKYNIYVPTEKEVLNDAVYKNILRLKYRSVQVLIFENIKEGRKQEDPQVQDHHLQIHQELKKIEDEIALALGIVVAK